MVEHQYLFSPTSAPTSASLLKKVSIEVFISVNGFCYDVTIKLYQHHVIKRVMHAVDTCRMLLMYSMYFVVVTLLFQLLAKHISAALPCNRLVSCSQTSFLAQGVIACSISARTKKESGMVHCAYSFLTPPLVQRC